MRWNPDDLPDLFVDHTDMDYEAILEDPRLIFIKEEANFQQANKKDRQANVDAGKVIFCIKIVD